MGQCCIDIEERAAADRPLETLIAILLASLTHY